MENITGFDPQNLPRQGVLTNDPNTLRRLNEMTVEPSRLSELGKDAMMFIKIAGEAALSWLHRPTS